VFSRTIYPGQLVTGGGPPQAARTKGSTTSETISSHRRAMKRIKQPPKSRNRIVTAGIKWITPGNAFDGQPTAFEYTMLVQRTRAIFRTRWIKATAGRQPARQRSLINFDEKDKNSPHTSLTGAGLCQILARCNVSVSAAAICVTDASVIGARAMRITSTPL